MNADMDTVVAVALLGIAAVSIIALAIIRPSFPDEEAPKPQKLNPNEACMVAGCGRPSESAIHGWRECTPHRVARTEVA